MTDPGMHGNAPLPNRVEAVVLGVMRYDVASGRISDLQLATSSAAECTPDGYRLPFEAVAYRVGD